MAERQDREEAGTHADRAGGAEVAHGHEPAAAADPLMHRKVTRRREQAAHHVHLSGVVAAGPALDAATMEALQAASPHTHLNPTSYIAYADTVKLGGSLAWRANNPGNLRGAPSQISKVKGAGGHFAVFASLDDGRAAQRALYLDKYGTETVREAVTKLTPPSENDTAAYLAKLQRAGIHLDKKVAPQIDALMAGVAHNEGVLAGKEVPRTA